MAKNLNDLLAERAALPANIRAAILLGPTGRLAELRRRAREIGEEIEAAKDVRADEQAAALRARIAALESEAAAATSAYHEAQAAHAALKDGAHTRARQLAFEEAQRLERPAIDARAQLQAQRERLAALVSSTLESATAPVVRSLPHAAR